MKKKYLAVALAAVMASATMAVSAGAASGINSYEQKVIGLISSPITVSSVGKTIVIPPQDVAAAENYFLTVDMTESEYNQVAGAVDRAKNLSLTASEASAIKAAASGSVIDMKALPESVKTKLLSYVNTAVEAVGLKATYDGSALSIVNASTNDVVFTTGSSVIKATGASVPASPIVSPYVLPAAAVLLAGAAVGYFILFMRRAEPRLEK